MNRRAFIKGLIALASAPAIGKYVNVFKTEGARKGIENVASQGVDFFNMVVKKVMDEGTLVKEEDRISTFKHPDRPDITVDVNQTDGTSSVYFDTDEGGKAMGEIHKTMDETTKGRTVEELYEAEEIYGPMGREEQEGITGGITNLEEFLKRKRGFATGGRVAPRDRKNDFSGIRAEDKKFIPVTPAPTPYQNWSYPNSPSGNNFLNQSLKTPNVTVDNTTRRQNVIQAMMQAKIPQQTIDEALGELGLKNGGRVGMFRGGVPKGLQAAMRAIMSKYGDDAITTADRAPQPEKTIQEQIMDFNARNRPDAITIDSREILDVPAVPGGFKLSKEKLMARFPELEESFVDEMMQMDPDLQGRIIKMLENRRLDPEAYDNLLDTKGDTLEFQGEFDKITRRKNNADGGSVDGDVSLTAIKIPDISESGVESLFKRR